LIKITMRSDREDYEDDLVGPADGLLVLDDELEEDAQQKPPPHETGLLPRGGGHLCLGDDSTDLTVQDGVMTVRMR